MALSPGVGKLITGEALPQASPASFPTSDFLGGGSRTAPGSSPFSTACNGGSPRIWSKWPATPGVRVALLVDLLTAERQHLDLGNEQISRSGSKARAIRCTNYFGAHPCRVCTVCTVCTLSIYGACTLFCCLRSSPLALRLKRDDLPSQAIGTQNRGRGCSFQFTYIAASCLVVDLPVPLGFLSFQIVGGCLPRVGRSSDGKLHYLHPTESQVRWGSTGSPTRLWRMVPGSEPILHPPSSSPRNFPRLLPLRNMAPCGVLAMIPFPFPKPSLTDGAFNGFPALIAA